MTSQDQALPANELLRLAEKADGRRGIAQSMVRITDGGTVSYDVLTQAEIDARRSSGATVSELIAVDAKPTSERRRRRERETKITIHVPKMKERTYNTDEVDAVFLTEAAVRKFVLPYYARTLTPTEYDTLLKAYYAPESDENGDDNEPFALVHYPTSQYHILGPT